MLKRENVKNILIPYSTNTHTQLAIEISPALMDYFSVPITIGLVVSHETSASEQIDIESQIQKDLRDNNVIAGIETIKDSDILKGILKLSKKTDLLVMGGKSGDFIELLFANSLTREITEQVKCPVLWLKEYEERKSFWSSLFKLQKIN